MGINSISKYLQKNELGNNEFFQTFLTRQWVEQPVSMQI